MISLIIPVYNSENYLNQLFNSLFSQINRDFEAIMIDDGSTDNSLKICQEVASQDNRFKVIHQDNQGVCVARNKGIKAASGHWITFIDSDDYIDPEYLSIEQDSNVDMYMQNWSIFGGASVKPEYLEPGIYAGGALKGLLAKNMHMDIFRMVSCKIYKKSIIDEHNIEFLPQFRVGEDTLFMLEYIKFTTSIQVLATGNYRYFRSSDWGAKYRICIDDAIAYFDAFVDRYKLQPNKCWKLLDFMVGWYPGIVSDFSTNKRKWYSSKSVKYAQNRTAIHKGNRYAISLVKIRFKQLLYAKD